MAPSSSAPTTRSKDKEGEKDEREVYNVDKDTVNIPKFNGDNYPIWVRKIRMHLRARELEEFIDTEMDEDDSESNQIRSNRVCNILSHGIDDSIFTSIITDENERDPYAIWSAIKDIYASDSMLSIFQVWNKWEDIQFDNDMNKYISAMLESLSEFSSIGIKIPDEIISCGIIGRITKKRPLLMQTMFSDIESLSKPKMIIAKLRDIGRHEKAMRKQVIPENQASSTALATNVKQKPKNHPSLQTRETQSRRVPSQI
jgi:hypothetical protein